MLVFVFPVKFASQSYGSLRRTTLLWMAERKRSKLSQKSLVEIISILLHYGRRSFRAEVHCAHEKSAGNKHLLSKEALDQDPAVVSTLI